MACLCLASCELLSLLLSLLGLLAEGKVPFLSPGTYPPPISVGLACIFSGRPLPAPGPRISSYLRCSIPYISFSVRLICSRSLCERWNHDQCEQVVWLRDEVISKEGSIVPWISFSFKDHRYKLTCNPSSLQWKTCSSTLQCLSLLTRISLSNVYRFLYIHVQDPCINELDPLYIENTVTLQGESSNWAIHKQLPNRYSRSKLILSKSSNFCCNESITSRFFCPSK